MKRVNAQGFTVVELTVAITITTLLLMVIMNFLANYLTQYSIDQIKGNLLSDAQVALDTMSEDIRLSASADDTNRWQDSHAPSAPANQLSWSSNANRLVLATAAVKQNDEIIFADPTEYISEKNNNIFFTSSNKLYKRVLAAPVSGNKAKTTCPAGQTTAACPADVVLAEGVKSFQIRYLSAEDQEVDPSDARAIEMTLALETERFNKTLDASYTTRMVFRND